MKFILAKKIEMTQKFAPDGRVIPVTKVIAGPCVVTKIKAIESDGYAAIQLGFGQKKNLAKPLLGSFKNLGNFRFIKEFRISDEEAKKIKVGDKLTAKIFNAGEKIKASGFSKGRGFAGVVKRHGFSGSPATHGHKDQLRMPGSIGSTGPQHVFKGVRMAGRMGAEKVTVNNLEVVEVNPETNEIFIKGALPGARNNLILISGLGDLIIEEPVKEEVKEKMETPNEVSVNQETPAVKIDEVKEEKPETSDK